MLAFEEALSRLLGGALPLGAERVPLDEAFGRVLAEDIVAREAMPAFDYSAMDGYAVRAADFQGEGPFELAVSGESAAGGDLPPRLALGTACRIFTGARLPEGADAIIMQEDVERRGDTITARSAPRPGEWVRLRGADMREGAVALTRGSRMTAGRVALAAGLDRPQIYVARRPVVTVLCTGDELRSPGEPGPLGSIPESNGYFVAAAGRAAGASVRIAPFVRDDPEEARAAVEAALRGADLCVTIGGVSVGDHDVMRPAFEVAGVSLDFWRVAIKPGKPLCVGRAGSAHVLGLPGNPASASLTFLLFGVPLLRALQGDPAPLPERLRVRAAGSLRRKAGRAEFLRAKLERGEGGAEARARILPNQASGAVTSFAEADALLVVPVDRERVDDGDVLEAIRIADI
jgi:molybdopterin molybdotransferase